MERVVVLDVEAIDAPGQAKAGGRCAIVTQVGGKMKVLFDAFVRPHFGDLSLCSKRNKALVDSIEMEFNDAVKRILKKVYNIPLLLAMTSIKIWISFLYHLQ